MCRMEFLWREVHRSTRWKWKSLILRSFPQEMLVLPGPSLGNTDGIVLVQLLWGGTGFALPLLLLSSH